MGTYTNPDYIAPATGAAVYKGIQTLAGDVYKFASDERDRKAALITESLAAQQAIDDNINKLGFNVQEGENNFQSQIIKEAEAIKRKINDQYLAMSKTFTTPAQIAEAKAKIIKLNKYPESLIEDLTTFQFLADQYNEGLQKQLGSGGSISMTNDENLIAVIGDMRNGGKNTKLETSETGTRVLVTNVAGKTHKLNLTAITNGRKNNPNYELFKKTVDDTEVVKDFETQLFGEATPQELIASGVFKYEEVKDIAGKKVNRYVFDKDAAKKAVGVVGQSLIKDPANYNYANSLWQDYLKNPVSLKTALGKLKEDGTYENEKAVLDILQEAYIAKAADAKGKQLGIVVAVTKPKRQPRTIVYNKTDDVLKALAEYAQGTGGAEIVPFNKTTYRVSKDKKNIEVVTEGGKIATSIPLYKTDAFGVALKDKNGNLVLNETGFQAITGDTKKETITIQ